MSLVFILVASANFVAFAWAVRFHFRSVRMPIGMIFLSISSLLNFGVSITHVVLYKPEPVSLVFAFVLLMLSAALFIWAVWSSRTASLYLAFDTVEPPALLDTGPYRFLRHPFYLSYSLFWAACAIVTSYLPIVLSSMALLSTYVLLAKREERSLLASSFGDGYRAYQARTGFMLPRMWS